MGGCCRDRRNPKALPFPGSACPICKVGTLSKLVRKVGPEARMCSNLACQTILERNDPRLRR